jgi:hypothetical protein
MEGRIKANRAEGQAHDKMFEHGEATRKRWAIDPGFGKPASFGWIISKNWFNAHAAASPKISQAQALVRF